MSNRLKRILEFTLLDFSKELWTGLLKAPFQEIRTKNLPPGFISSI